MRRRCRGGWGRRQSRVRCLVRVRVGFGGEGGEADVDDDLVDVGVVGGGDLPGQERPGDPDQRVGQAGGVLGGVAALIGEPVPARAWPRCRGRDVPAGTSRPAAAGGAAGPGPPLVPGPPPWPESAWGSRGGVGGGGRGRRRGKRRRWAGPGTGLPTAPPAG